MSKLEQLQAQLLNEKDFMKKLEIKDEIRKLEGKEVVNTCNLNEECLNCGS